MATAEAVEILSDDLHVTGGHAELVADDLRKLSSLAPVVAAQAQRALPVG